MKDRGLRPKQHVTSKWLYLISHAIDGFLGRCNDCKSVLVQHCSEVEGEHSTDRIRKDSWNRSLYLEVLVGVFPYSSMTSAKLGSEPAQGLPLQLGVLRPVSRSSAVSCAGIYTVWRLSQAPRRQALRRGR
jgi:hypothetical protein